MKIDCNASYEKRITLCVRHAYRSGSEAPVSLSASRETEVCLRRNQAVLRRDAPGHWSVCVPAGEPLHGEQPLRFEIRPLARDFLYYSRLSEGGGDGWKIVPDNAPGGWKAIEIPAETSASGNNCQEITVNIETVERYIEFLLIPKYNDPGIRLKLTENKNAVHFTEPENVRLWDHAQVQRIVSEKPLPLRSPQPFKMKLLEIRNSGERVLSDAVPFPACDSPSPFDPKTTITTYFYY